MTNGGGDRCGKSGMSATEQFRLVIAAAGLRPPDEVIADGRPHRFPTNGRADDDAGWYIFYGDGIPAGAFGDWRTGVSETWRANIGRRQTTGESAAYRAKLEGIRKAREAEEMQRHAEARRQAAAIWNAATPASDEHPYLARKGVSAYGLRVHADGRLIVPLRDNGELHSLQFIDSDGDKLFLPGGRVGGCYHAIGTLDGAAALCICEGYATGATIHAAKSYPVAAAFNAGNLLAVAKAMRARCPELRLIVCGDDDIGTKGNPGLSKATEAARAVGGWLAVPDFGADRPAKATDFNDLAAHRGAEAVAEAIMQARPVDDDDVKTEREWPEPLPLVATVDPEAYPVDALPDLIRGAVEEVQAFTKAPIAMVASSAIGAVSVVAQAYVDVQRAPRLTGPSSLYLLTIGESGERKSTCDDYFTVPIQEYEKRQSLAMAPAVADHSADLEAWTAMRNGLLDKIRAAKKANQPTDVTAAALRDLERDKPKPPRVPRLLRGDDTPENLAWELSRGWPSAGVLSSEAGLILGAHGMNRETIMRHLSLLNILWDGRSHSIGRRTSESFTVRGVRFTVALLVQEPTLRNFFEQSGRLARGIGFLARFLVAWPPSTQGYRPYADPPSYWPHLDAYHHRLKEILDVVPTMEDDGALTPTLLVLSRAAKATWIDYHDEIEFELRTGGELYDVRDVASKSADNAARLAALFHVFERDSSGAIEADIFEGASRIAAWHLNESRRFFGEMAMPIEVSGAMRLDAWLLDYCRREQTQSVPVSEIQKSGPSGLREKAAIEAAAAELGELRRARLVRAGHARTIAVNPALLSTTARTAKTATAESTAGGLA